MAKVVQLPTPKGRQKAKILSMMRCAEGPRGVVRFSLSRDLTEAEADFVLETMHRTLALMPDMDS